MEIMGFYDEAQRQAFKKVKNFEEQQIEYILRHWIDNPIKGEITPEALKNSCVRTLFYAEPFPPQIIVEEGNVKISLTSSFLGVVQGDFIVFPDGTRKELTDDQKSFLHLQGI
jgi:hypothetical protein